MTYALILTAAQVDMRRKWRRMCRENGLMIRNFLRARDGIGCVYCGIPLVEHAYCGGSPPSGARLPEVDHVMPIVRGGTNDLENLVLCCGMCNTRKSTRLP